MKWLPSTLAESIPPYVLAQLQPWQMNLLALSSDGTCFIAAGNSIHRLGSDEVLTPQPEGVIHQIKHGIIGRDLEVVVAVNEGGAVSIFPIKSALPQMHFANELPGVAPTWGLSMAGYRIACSANDHAILLIDLGGTTMNEGDRMTRKLRRHNHNVPSIAFSACSRYLASGSIDGTVLVWDLEDEDRVIMRVVSDAWKWAVTFIPPSIVRGLYEGRELLLFTTAEDVVLIDCTGSVLACIEGALNSFVQQSLRPINRLSLLSISRCFGLVVLASQAGAAAFVEICCNNGEFSMTLEAIETKSYLYGMSVTDNEVALLCQREIVWHRIFEDKSVADRFKIDQLPL